MTTVSDLDVFRSANLLVNQHGAEAPIEAAIHADAIAITEPFYSAA